MKFILQAKIIEFWELVLFESKNCCIQTLFKITFKEVQFEAMKAEMSQENTYQSNALF